MLTLYKYNCVSQYKQIIPIYIDVYYSNCDKINKCKFTTGPKFSNLQFEELQKRKETRFP